MRELKGIHLSGLRAIETVARLGTLREAAEELGVTPGAVSQQIIKAEDQLGCRLFERVSKGLVPTSIGQQVADHLSAGFRSIARGVALVKERPTNTITISVPPIFAGKWLVWRLNGFAEQHPEIRVRIDATVSLIDLRMGDADACIRVGRGDWPDVQMEKLLAQRVFPVCAPSLSEKLTTLADLSQVPIIRDTHSMFEWDLWLNPNDMSENQLGNGPEFSDAALCLDAAIAGQGVFLAWETLAQDALAMGRLIVPFPGRFKTGISYWFAESDDRRRTPQVEAFRHWLVDELARGRT